MKTEKKQHPHWWMRFVDWDNATQVADPSPADSPEWREVFALAESIRTEGWRSSTPTRAEGALGYAAFYYWLVGGEQLTGDPYHYSYPSASTRLVSAMVMKIVADNHKLTEAVRKQKSGFNPDRELELLPLKPSDKHPEWGEPATRFVIMLCRTLACASTGMIGSLKHINTGEPFSCLRLGKALADYAFGKTLQQVLYPNSNLSGFKGGRDRGGVSLCRAIP